jgi:hypothetical protein
MDLLFAILGIEKATLEPSRLVSWIVLLCVTLGGTVGLCEENPPSEFQVEAAFLYHFASFVTWPPEAFPGENTPITIGVMGEETFSTELENTIRNKSVNGRELKVLRLDFKASEDARHCHILFIGTSDRKRVNEILDALKGASVLTVGKMERFTQSSGIINFVHEGKKIRFEINDEAAKRAGLKISAKLLSLSRTKGSA